MPSVSAFTEELAATGATKKSFCADADCTYEESLVKELSKLNGEIYKLTGKLEEVVSKASDITDTNKALTYFKDDVIGAMNELRSVVDKAEPLMSKDYLPYPTYGELLFGVR